MRLNFLLLLLLFAANTQAAQLARTTCETKDSEASCRIELEGEVSEGDRLFLSRVNDRDRLSFNGRELGSTGSFLGREFQAGFFPRVYPLFGIKGERSPTLILEIFSGPRHIPGIPPGAKVKIIDAKYPLWKILGGAALQLLSFILLAGLSVQLVLGLRERNTDGWLFPPEELRWFIGALSAYLLLYHEVSELFVPLFWSPQAHLLGQRIALAVMLWSLTRLLLNGRFSDRSCIERHRPRAPAIYLSRLADSALVLSLSLLVFYPVMAERLAAIMLFVPLHPLALALWRAARGLEWRRVWKRSSLSPLLFQLSLMLLPLGAFATFMMAVLGGAGDQRWLALMGWVALLSSALRLRNFLQGKALSIVLAGKCRVLLIRHAFGSARLQALCDFVADEWGAARITVISIDGENGLVLASAGPEAIPAANHAEPRRLGPFLRRVCKQEQMLYAPVAEELGKDLQSEGLKHSSLAIPLFQERQISAVVCMMADESERIPPADAVQLELFIEFLSLEIVSAVAQHVAETKNQQLLNIARGADALAVERLDHWGHVQQTKETETRVVLGGDCIPVGPFFEQLKKSMVTGKIWAGYRSELRTLWTVMATAFEFIPKDNRDDFWVISPREFHNPLFRELGAERVALLLATALDRHSRVLSGKDCYSVLGYCGVRLACSTVRLRQSTWHGSAVELDSEDFSLLLSLRQHAYPGNVLFHGKLAELSSEGGTAFTCRARPWIENENQQIFSILAATADKKEIRKIENQALEKVRGLPRKVA